MLCTISVRGDVVPACIAAHMLIPSTFTGPVPAMLLSGSCAIFATVGYQSTMLCRILHRQQPHSPMLRATATRGRGKLRGKNRRCSLLHHAVPARTLHCFLQQRRAHHRHPTNAPLPLSAFRPSGNHHFKCSKIVVSEEVCEESCTQALGFQSSYRRGQLFPASRYFPEFVAPPLSVASTTIELANIPCSAKHST
jgi:hypothetical protein